MLCCSILIVFLFFLFFCFFFFILIQETSPKWFIMFWRFVSISNVLVLLVCATIALIQGKLQAIQFRDLYFDFLVVITVLVFIGMLCQVRKRIFQAESDLKRQVSQQNIVARNSGTDVLATKQPTDLSSMNQITIRTETLKNLKKLTQTRVRMDFVGIFLILLIAFTC